MYSSDLRKQMTQGWNTWYNESVTAHVLLPYGFAINLRFSSDFNELGFKVRDTILHDTLFGRDPSVKADIRSWDGKYTCVHISHKNKNLLVESSVQDGQQIILVTPENEGETKEYLIVETCFLWGKDGTLLKENGQLTGICPDGTAVRVYADGVLSNCYLPTVQTPSMIFEMDTPVSVATFPCSIEEARKRMTEARSAVYSEAEKYGKHAETFLAIQCCLGWNTIYDPCKGRICTPVSRNWNHGQGSVLFCWDTFFAAQMFTLGCREFAYLSVFAMLDEMTEEGMLPNYCDRQHKSYDRSQPPVGSMVVEYIWKKYGDTEFIQEVYPKLMRWNTWFFENRMTEEGYLCWGSKAPASGKGSPKGLDGTQVLQGAKYESGLDNSPMYDTVEYNEETGLMVLADVGLSGLFIKDCRSLMVMAKAAGYPEDISILAARKEKAEKALLKLWNPETGIFENRDLTDGSLSHRLSPTNFYSLFSLAVTNEQKQSMVNNYLLNPKEFWGDYVLPSISQSDPAFGDQVYWRGRVWGPMNAIVYEALRDAGMDAAADKLAFRSEELFLIEWREHRHVHENYSAIDGLGCNSPHSDPFYHWGGLLGYIAINTAERKGDIL